MKSSEPQPEDGAPSVKSTDPDDGDAEVDRERTLSVTFSEPVTAQDDAFSLSCDGVPVSLTVTRQGADDLRPGPADDPARRRLVHDRRRRRPLPRRRHHRPARHGQRPHGRVQHGRADRPADPRHPGRRAPLAIRGRGRVARPGRRDRRAQHRLLHAGPAADADEATSEAIFVFTSTAPTVAESTAVEVSGPVDEFRGGLRAQLRGSNSAYDNLTITEIDRATVYPVGPADPIAPTLVGQAAMSRRSGSPRTTRSATSRLGNVLFDPEEDGLDWHESLEGMLVEIAAPEVTGLRTTFGELPVVSDGAASIRTPRGGVRDLGGRHQPRAVHPRGRPRADPTAQVGDTLGSSIVAIADYGFGDYLYYPTSTPTVTTGDLQREVTDAKRANQLAIASMNVENLDPADPQDKYDRLASIVVDNLAARTSSPWRRSRTTTARPRPHRDADAHLHAADRRRSRRPAARATSSGRSTRSTTTDGGEPSGNIRVGFLFRTDRGLEFVDRAGRDGEHAEQRDRRPGRARAAVQPGPHRPDQPGVRPAAASRWPPSSSGRAGPCSRSRTTSTRRAATTRCSAASSRRCESSTSSGTSRRTSSPASSRTSSRPTRAPRSP